MISVSSLKPLMAYSYVESLMKRVETLKAASRLSVEPLSVADQVFVHDEAESLESLQSAPSLSLSFDKHFLFLSGGRESFQFYGSSSVFTLTVQLMHHAFKKELVSIDTTSEGARHVDVSGTDEYYHLVLDRFPQVDHVKCLLQLYLVSSNTMYGIVDEAAAWTDLEAYLDLRTREDMHYTALRGEKAHQYFRVSMMCAIACATRARYQPTCTGESMAYYSDALTCLEDVTSEVSAASLQALMLLVVFCLFFPGKGDIWKLLDYACRLSVELGYHTEQAADQETDMQRRLRRSTFWGLYAIERIVGQLFGRGSDLPEPIITTEYPNAVTVTSPLDHDQASFQPISIAHHYRLVYLRSEIYKELYLPGTQPKFDNKWYTERHATLQAWRNDLPTLDDLTGVSTITCDVGYHSTICFLFQPLILEAISQTCKDATNTPKTFASIPQDNYWSACELIRTYAKVMRAPESSALGTYPITFMSAHYMYLAGLTVLAHCLIALDGRVGTWKSLDEANMITSPSCEAVIEEGNIDFTDLYEVSGTCLILLTWCAERWSGMVGMLDIYKSLSDKLIPAMIRRGLV
ncbi:hypothetical protein M8818_005835 [Zalaria obscura]|uniref:Uncharacterized protein n=1 Tax=Zalaria obscura TaxID=2024903 RepID=A0ACC3S8C2_9PEZI